MDSCGCIREKNDMKKFLEWTAWPMTPPKSYGLFHILFVLIGFTIVIVGAWFLRKTNSKQNRIVLLSVGLFLIITEIYKQLFYFFVINNGSYQWSIFPFQVCSVPMYLCIICACSKNEKFNTVLYNFLFAFNFLGGAIAFTEPSGLNHPYWTLTLHAYVWHVMLVFLGFYLLFSGRAANHWLDYIKSSSVLGVCAVLAQIFNVSFHKLGFITMFFISPYYSNNLAFFDNFYKTHGWVANMFLFLFALLLGSAIIFYSCWGIKLLIKYRKKLKNT